MRANIEIGANGGERKLGVIAQRKSGAVRACRSEKTGATRVRQCNASHRLSLTENHRCVDPSAERSDNLRHSNSEASQTDRGTKPPGGVTVAARALGQPAACGGSDGRKFNSGGSQTLRVRRPVKRDTEPHERAATYASDASARQLRRCDSPQLVATEHTSTKRRRHGREVLRLIANTQATAGKNPSVRPERNVVPVTKPAARGDIHGRALRHEGSLDWRLQHASAWTTQAQPAPAKVWRHGTLSGRLHGAARQRRKWRERLRWRSLRAAGPGPHAALARCRESQVRVDRREQHLDSASPWSPRLVPASDRSQTLVKAERSRVLQPAKRPRAIDHVHAFAGTQACRQREVRTRLDGSAATQCARPALPAGQLPKELLDQRASQWARHLPQRRDQAGRVAAGRAVSLPAGASRLLLRAALAIDAFPASTTRVSRPFRPEPRVPARFLLRRADSWRDSSWQASAIQERLANMLRDNRPATFCFPWPLPSVRASSITRIARSRITSGDEAIGADAKPAPAPERAKNFFCDVYQARSGGICTRRRAAAGSRGFRENYTLRPRDTGEERAVTR